MQLAEDARLPINVHLADTKMHLSNVSRFVLLEPISLILLVILVNVLLDTKSNKLIEHVLKMLLHLDVLVLNSFKEESV